MPSHGRVEQLGLLRRQRRAGHPVDGGGRRGPADQAGTLLEALDPLGPVLAVGLEAGALAVLEFRLDQLAQLRRAVRLGLDALEVRRVQLARAVEVVHGAEAIEHDVVRAQIPEPMVVAQLQDGEPDQAVGEQVQRTAVLGAHPLVRDRLGVVLAAQVDIDDLVPVRDGRVDVLHRLAVALGQAHEARIELVRGVDAGPPQDLTVQIAPQIDVLGDVDRHLRIQMLGIPDTELRRREREEFVPRNRRGRHLAASFAVAAEIQPVQP
ncbi:hypothetical protein NWFMUON74_64250 [Nocardia wallacei]|uniref:Uncharacterized protein n=1 Tax=Nocardia wallacei TaxID=480035 RepID=A0A7G1KWU9_9NOCA|nr:hypothetical protein NWFMUON74_64250 [Nocardia wallacei]